jgi:hypothetical protein
MIEVAHILMAIDVPLKQGPHAYGGAMTGKMVLTDFIDSAIAEGKLIRDVSSLKMIPQSGSETGAGKAASPIMSVNVRMSRTMLP